KAFSDTGFQPPSNGFLPKQIVEQTWCQNPEVSGRSSGLVAPSTATAGIQRTVTYCLFPVNSNRGRVRCAGTFEKEGKLRPFYQGGRWGEFAHRLSRCCSVLLSFRRQPVAAI